LTPVQAPSGGEFSSSIDLETLLTDDFDRALSYLRFMHTTWLGPHSPRQSKLSPAAWESAQRLEQEMGYCFTLRSAALRTWPGAIRQLILSFENIGIAPMYADWPLRIEIRDAAGHVIATRDYPAPTSTWLTTGTLRLILPHCVGGPSTQTLWLGFVDPLTTQCRLALANSLPESNNLFCIGTITAEGMLE